MMKRRSVKLCVSKIIYINRSFYISFCTEEFSMRRTYEIIGFKHFVKGFFFIILIDMRRLHHGPFGPNVGIL